jgi:hypothetical protein
MSIDADIPAKYRGTLFFALADVEADGLHRLFMFGEEIGSCDPEYTIAETAAKYGGRGSILCVIDGLTEEAIDVLQSQITAMGGRITCSRAAILNLLHVERQ